MRGRKIAGAIRSLQLECGRVLHEALLKPVLVYGSEICGEMKRLKIRAIQMNIRGFLGIRNEDKFSNARIRGLCGVMK